ncbi:MAG: hypothetical protein L0Z51_07875 [Candidatus Latescibacteria bacterium]|nr:hypothetical protein [Candidatus Latescibacterota bacterium]
MRGLFVGISKAYRYSLDAKAFADPKNRDEIMTTLDALARNAEQLQSHGGGLDPSFDYMKRSLSRDAHDALESFKAFNDVGTRFILSDITENCVTCHTKLPATRPFEAGKQFLEDIDVKSFPAPARAKLQVASRQFSDAVKTYEEIILSKKTTAEDLMVFDIFDNYLSVCIGAMNDLKRPVPTLDKFVGRTDMPENVTTYARAWIGSLEALNLGVATGGELAAARRLVTDARKKSPTRNDRSGLVDFIGSITLLHRHLRSNPKDDVSVAESYYLLGVAESYVYRTYWVSETEYLLDHSIRVAPKSDVAKQAIAYLEEYRSSQTSVPARVIPPDMQVNIEELRKLTEQ